MAMSSRGPELCWSVATSVIAGDLLDPVEEQCRPVVQLAGIGVIQRVLILGFRDPAADGDVLRGLHIERDALDLGQVGPQAREYRFHAVALLVGLERNVDAAVVDRGVAAAGADRRADGCDGRVLHDGIEQRLLALGHRGIGNILCGFGQADDQPGVLLRKEAFGNDHVEIAGQCDGRKHRE